ncbi:GTPase-activating Rap/Ran-GAP domain-like protein 3 [Actinia tenebrosa]|uniref:GTPase-activating Rap/Ran-GAP domain-like protein 3 n=1 Tax=Actinia tenebrosa TaxID=6105 RepID=A0A6P8JCC2_ACTTE|nr:GTPase-activating Rap/Ran-GAP domain-like protein 3 [Actinia tenebrosa]
MALRIQNEDAKSDRPKSSFITEQQQQRPPMKNRFSSPPGSLILVSEQDLDCESTSALRVPSPDVGRRPGLSRRHYYGSLETLNTVNGNYETSGVTPKFRIESGEIGGLQNGSPTSSQGSVVHLENPEFQTRWYFKYYLGKVHQNYIGVDGKQNPFILSICLTAADNYDVPQYRAILWKKTSLKLKTIVKGDAPTSLITTSANVKAEPWQQQTVYEDFPHKILCGDSWGDALVLGTESGIFVVLGDSIRQLFDKSVITKQLSVDEAYGLLLFHVDKGKDFHNSRICAFKLFNFEDEDQVAKAKDDCKQHKLPKTKGCHLYAVSHTSGSQPLFMGVACGKKVLLMKWKYPVVWNTSAAATSGTRELIEGFVVVKEITMSDSPLLMTVTLAANKDSLLCVGYKHFFDLIRHTGETTRLHSVDTQKKTTLVSAVDVYEDEEPELLLSFNHQSVFKKLSGEQSSNFYFNWNSAPRSIVCAFPYLLAFTNTTIEIRLVVNGNLVHTLALPKLELITSKWDIYFAASPPKRTSVLSNDQTTQSNSCPPSPTLPREHSCIYKISLYSLMGQFLSPTLKCSEEFPKTTAFTEEGADTEDGHEAESRDSLGSPVIEANSTLLPQKDALSRTHSCPIPARETLSVFSEEVELWNRRGSRDKEDFSQTLKT